VVEQTQTLHIINEPEISIHSAPGSPRRVFFSLPAPPPPPPPTFVCLTERLYRGIHTHTHTYTHTFVIRPYAVFSLSIDHFLLTHSSAYLCIVPSPSLSHAHCLSISPLDRSSLSLPLTHTLLSLSFRIHNTHGRGILAPVFMCPRVRTPTHPHTHISIYARVCVCVPILLVYSIYVRASAADNPSDARLLYVFSVCQPNGVACTHLCNVYLPSRGGGGRGRFEGLTRGRGFPFISANVVLNNMYYIFLYIVYIGIVRCACSVHDIL